MFSNLSKGVHFSVQDRRNAGGIKKSMLICSWKCGERNNRQCEKTRKISLFQALQKNSLPKPEGLCCMKVCYIRQEHKPLCLVVFHSSLYANHCFFRIFSGIFCFLYNRVSQSHQIYTTFLQFYRLLFADKSKYLFLSVPIPQFISEIQQSTYTLVKQYLVHRHKHIPLF